MLYRIMVSCFIGATVGSAVALQFQPEVFSLAVILGMAVGAAVGWGVFVSPKLPAAMKTAWTDVVGWRPFWPWWRAMGRAGLYLSLMSYMFIGAPCLGERFFTPDKATTPASLAVFLSVAFAACLFLLALVFSDGFKHYKRHRYVDLERLRSNELRSRRGWLIALGSVGAFSIVSFLAYQPTVRSILIGVGMLFGALVVLGIALGIACKVVPWLWKRRMVPVIFSVTVFKLVHCRLALLVAVSSAIGVLIGAHSGQPLLGGVIGALWGAIDYEIVSKRWLKLVPARGA
ncbi:MAG: hypothetical protein COU11_02940 [Candidatus Harrisonbacteria bacterium CG10_big_fil_rev_8_21_14_0_10_49_15]|uniref:Uncharacterized protein n=1 Tax=Candidatus Harrisonbacteria bacterium CG10_big_fil_rev_8_21_14_0_10_49_15 TaxID=1974587 RepID=A0A2H0UME8_9BACT|nr:MAG: hypothetical protein COU11_02940 [Candidatus Harrisonbacteria bacterium CG10_big_fil_rev_8_21_14_0_10_49_15]